MKTPSRYPYFAYGSNMDADQMRDRCPASAMLGKAELNGYHFIINSRGVASIVPDDSSTVHGVLWQTTEEDEARLDRYEGVAHGLYSKDILKVSNQNGDVVRALVYIAADSVDGKPRNGYVARIIKAAEWVGLPQAYLVELRKWAE